jgi:hypothetical protein
MKSKVNGQGLQVGKMDEMKKFGKSNTIKKTAINSEFRCDGTQIM